MGHSTSTTRIKTKKIAMLITYASTYNVTKKIEEVHPAWWVGEGGHCHLLVTSLAFT